MDRLIREHLATHPTPLLHRGINTPAAGTANVNMRCSGSTRQPMRETDRGERGSQLDTHVHNALTKAVPPHQSNPTETTEQAVAR